MSTIIAPTRMLVGMITDLLLTASADPDLPGIRGVLLHTCDGEYVPDLPGADEGDEPLIDAIASDLLVGTSTDRGAIGQAHVPVEFTTPLGWLHPAFVSLPDLQAVLAAFKPLVPSLGKEVMHRCELTVTAGTLTIREDPNLVPNGLRMTFSVGDGSDYPETDVRMQPDPTVQVAGLDSEIVPPSYGTGYHPRYLEAFGKIGKRRQMPIAVYRHHQSRAVVVEIGASYRAAVRPYKLDEDHGQHLAPTVRVFAPPTHDRSSKEEVAN